MEWEPSQERRYWSLVDRFGPIRDTIKSTVATTGIEKSETLYYQGMDFFFFNLSIP